MPSAPGWDEASGPAKAFRAQEERKSQESVLGRIFDVEPFLNKKPQQRKSLKGKEKVASADAVMAKSGTAGEAYMSRLREVSSKLMAMNLHADDESKQEVLEIIEKASRKYLEEVEIAKTAEEAPKTNQASSGESSSTAPGAASTDTTQITPAESSDATATATAGAVAADVADDSSRPKAKAKSGTDANPEDINVEEPIATEEVEEPSAESKNDQVKDDSPAVAEAVLKQTESKPETSESPAKLRAISTLAKQRANFETLVARLQHLISEATLLSEKLDSLRNGAYGYDREYIRASEKQLHSFYRDIENVRVELNATEAEIRDVEKQVHGIATTAHGEDERISDYIRSTRGLALRSFSVHLIPVKASVLKAAIDVRVLKRLTLLNVGNQNPIWTMLAKENKIQGLPLRKIFTDNVSSIFLTFAAQLEEITELFMLERSVKYKPESFAPKTNVIMDQIRRLVLKKHMPTLTKLMIKNDSGSSWDVDERAMLLICNRGRKLEELAAAVGIRAIVSIPCHPLTDRLRRELTFKSIHSCSTFQDWSICEH